MLYIMLNIRLLILVTKGSAGGNYSILTGANSFDPEEASLLNSKRGVRRGMVFLS